MTQESKGGGKTASDWRRVHKNEVCDYFSHAKDLEGEDEKANGDAEGF